MTRKNQNQKSFASKSGALRVERAAGTAVSPVESPCHFRVKEEGNTQNKGEQHVSFHLLKGHDFQRAQGRHLGCWLEMKKRSSSCAWAYRDCSIKLTGVMWSSAALVMTDILKHNGIGLIELKVHSDNKA